MANSYYQYITGAGIIVPDTSTLLSDVQAEFTSLFGADLDLSPETVQGRIIEMIVRERSFVIQMTAAVSNMLNLGKAYGFILDDLGALFMISRKRATSTTTTVVMSGVPGTIIPAGTRLQSTGGDKFVNNIAYTIGAAGSVNALYSSEETGAVPAPANSITTILDTVNGLETVINPGNPVLGQDQESDNIFRERIRQSLNLNSIAIIDAIKSSIENLTNVVGTYCYDNDSDINVIIDGITVPKHSIMVVVDGGDEQEIANTIWSKKSLGCGYVAPGDGVITREVIDPAYGTTYNVSFLRPVIEQVDVEITVNRQNYTGSDLTAAVKQAIMNWQAGENPEVDGIKIGGSVSPFEISAAVSSELPDIFIAGVGVALHGETPAADTLTFGEVHKAQITEDNITVTING